MIKRLKILIQQRDNEIIILLNLINKSKKPNGEENSLSLPVYRDSQAPTSDLLSSYHSQLKPIKFPENTSETSNSKAKSMNFEENSNKFKNAEEILSKFKSLSGNSKESVFSGTTFPSVTKTINGSIDLNEALYSPLNVTNEQLMDRAACFEMFRKSYRRNEVMEEHKEILKKKFEEGKVLGEKVNKARSFIIQLKNQVIFVFY